MKQIPNIHAHAWNQPPEERQSQRLRELLAQVRAKPTTTKDPDYYAKLLANIRKYGGKNT